MSAPPAREGSTIGVWLDRQAGLLRLLRSRNYRRNSLTILIQSLRSEAGWQYLASLIILPAALLFLTQRYAASARDVYDFCQGAMLLAAAGMGAMLYAADQRQGTLDLLWLATGSERAMLWLRMVVNAILLAAMTAACLGAVSIVPAAQEMNMLRAFLMITIMEWFVLAAMALLGTYFSQSWSAGIIGLALFAAWFWYWRGSGSMLYPFLNPESAEPPGQIPAPDFGGGDEGFRGGRGRGNGGGDGLSATIINRAVWLAAAIFLFRAAGARLRKIL